jgi:hypothetical protein
MWRRLNRDDFTGSSPLLPRHGEHYAPWPVRWRVYRDYEILPAPDGSGWHYIQAVGRENDGQLECVRSYNPLIDTPYLFLEFARIVERKDPWQTLVDWFQQYGLLGITAYPVTESREHWKGIVFPRRYHDDRGGTWDRVEVIWELAYQANESLTLYEAVLGRDEEKLERVLSLESEPEYADTSQKRAKVSGVERVDALIASALWQMLEYALGDLYEYAYPDITYTDDYLTIDQLTRSWGARNLLGAMGLQFYWLITSAGELSHCKYCGRIISYAPPMPGSATDRKPRNDKEFCDSRCRQNYHYHNRIKPRRQSSYS